MSLTTSITAGMKLSRKTNPVMSIFLSDRAETRSVEKPNLGLSESGKSDRVAGSAHLQSTRVGIVGG